MKKIKDTEKDLNIVELFHALYCDVLLLYEKTSPGCLISTNNIFKTKSNGNEITSFPKVRLVPNSYYWKNKDEIQKLQSFD